MKKILVVAAHPDDEVLGCGATMAKYAAQGNPVHVAILAEGLTSRDKARNRDKRSDDLSNLQSIACEANALLGVKSVEFYGFPDNRMDCVDRLDVVKVVEELISRHQPEIVMTHYGADMNIDHRITCEAVLTACRPLPACPVKLILHFEIPSSTEWQVLGPAQHFAPTWFVDVSSSFALKLDALGCYQNEMREWPHPRSLQAIEQLAGWRGATAGMQVAEAFAVGRCLA